MTTLVGFTNGEFWTGYEEFGRPSRSPAASAATRWGLEVRCHHGESVDALIQSERAADVDIAHDIAEAWKQAAIDKGFTEVDGDQT